MTQRGRWPLVLGGLALAVLAAWPLASGQPYLLNLGILTLMYVTLAASWNLISGYTGYVSFGHVAFFGVGAYTTALLITRLKVFWLLAAVAGGGLAALLALPLGLLALRLKGPYFAIAMLGLAETLSIVASVWEPVTRGARGIFLPPVLDLTSVYLVMAAMAATVVLLTYRLATSKFGLRLLGIREDEGALESIGINTTWHKLAAFILSAFFPGIVGGVYAYNTTFIEPASVFASAITIRMIVMTMFGGAGTVFGPVIGGVVLTLVAEWLWSEFTGIHQVLFGALIIGLVVFMPGGVLALGRNLGWLPKTRGL